MIPEPNDKHIDLERDTRELTDSKIAAGQGSVNEELDVKQKRPANVRCGSTERELLKNRFDKI